jgi:hypothetical protein
MPPLRAALKVTMRRMSAGVSLGLRSSKSATMPLQTLQEVPYNKWREYDPEDTLRFYALRLREAGMIKSTPNKLIADATDWRFLNELKRELKS